eukprot:5092153-Heterocapsa_arctica.AAC.1
MAKAERSNAVLYGKDVTPADRRGLAGVPEERSTTARDAAHAAARLRHSGVRKRGPADDEGPSAHSAPGNAPA